MSNLIPYLPLDESGLNPNNLVTNEEQVLLAVEGVKYPVVVLENGGFYTRDLQVLDSNYQPLTPVTDYIATYKYADASAYTGLEICGSIVILNPAITGSVLVTAQMVGGDLTFSLTAREDTLTYLKGLGSTPPIWSGFLGQEPMWEDGELRRDRWSLKGMESFIFELENIVRAMKTGDPQAEDAFRKYALAEYNDFKAHWSNGLNTHLQDHANPHVDTKAMIGLDLVNNFPVASTALAQAGTDNASYLTPSLMYAEATTLALGPLNAHLADVSNPHKETAALVGVYTTAQLDALVAQKLRTDATAVNSNAIEGRSYTTAYNDIRANLPAGNFVSGVFSPERLGVGGYNSEYVLLGDGSWVAVSTLFSQYSTGGGGIVIYVGSYSDPNTVLANVAASFADTNAYPVGTVVIWRYVYLVYQGYGNGTTHYNINPTRAIVRTASGWQHLA